MGSHRRRRPGCCSGVAHDYAGSAPLRSAEEIRLAGWCMLANWFASWQGFAERKISETTGRILKAKTP